MDANTNRQKLKSSSAPLSKLRNLLDGSFDNFQQCWQQQTEEDLHRVEMHPLHRHWHLQFEPVKDEGNHSLGWQVQYFENRKDNAARVEYWYFIHDPSTDEIRSIHREDSAKGKILVECSWEISDNSAIAKSVAGNFSLELNANELQITQSTGPFAHPHTSYDLRPCRFFAGWIEYPLPGKEDYVHRQAHQTIHDQGGLIQLRLPNGDSAGYSVELTQLVYGKQIAIMKLAIYQEPHDAIHYNSKAISYTWTNPEAKRIGINLRTILSGWTLVEKDWVNSDGMTE